MDRPSVSVPMAGSTVTLRGFGRGSVTASFLWDAWSGQTAAAPPQSNQPLRADKPSTVPWVFTADLHGLPAPSRVLAPPCFTVRQGMGAFTRDLFLISEAVQPPSRPAYASGGAELPLNRRGHVVERLLGLDAIAPSPGCGSPEGGRSCRLGAHRRPMPGGRLVRMDCSSACRSLALFEQLLTSCFLF